MQGFVDAMREGAVLGWAEDGTSEAVSIEVMLNGERIGAGRADRFRPDLGRSVGYRVELARAVRASDFVAGHVQVAAIGADGGRTILPIAAAAGFVEVVLRETLRAMPGVEFREMIGRALIDRRASDNVPGTVDSPGAGAAVASFTVPVGTLSPDAEVVVGHDGHLFVITGSNGLAAQYAPSPGTDALATTWSDLFERRQEALAQRGIEYLQLIIPEKASILADLLPFPVSPPTLLYQALAARLSASPASASFLDLYPPLALLPERRHIYLKLDSHFSARGAHRAFALMLGKLGIAVPPIAFSRPERATPADLAHHFPWNGFVEDDLLPEPTAFPPALSTPVCTIDERPKRHLGTRLVFTNPAAPIAKRVVAFANSFFLRGETMQQLSWWMKHWFREYHFVWSNEVDLHYVDSTKPDIVIAQTIERFLPLPPAN